MNTPRAIKLFTLSVLCLPLACAKVRVPNVFGDHMVLQRELPVPVWGWADPGEKVTVSFAGQSSSAVADADGKWTLKLAALSASASPEELCVSGRNTVRFADVLVGDVWLGSGQSNMEFAMREVLNAKEEIAGANKPLIRLFTVPRCEKAQMEDWIAQTKKALASGGRVPVAPEWPNHPGLEFTGLYRGMIYPLVPFALRGFVWYQGEWNGGENDIYVKRMQALIGGWRAVWGNPDLPFYYVQLARMPQKDCLPWQGDGLSPTREAQRKCLSIPHTGMATIIDLEGSQR
jgi:sialate O-acetylesterase